MPEYRDYPDHGGWGAHCLGAFDGDTLAGYMAWDEPEDRDGDAQGVYVHVLWVAPGYRGQGIGTELIKRVTASVKGRDLAETIHAAEHFLFTPELRRFRAKVEKDHPLPSPSAPADN